MQLLSDVEAALNQVIVAANKELEIALANRVGQLEAAESISSGAQEIKNATVRAYLEHVRSHGCQ